MRNSRFIIRHGRIMNIPQLHPSELGFAIDDRVLFIGSRTGNIQLTTRVKGSAEDEYRIGDIEITKENIGLDEVDNTPDSKKSVKSAESSEESKYITTNDDIGSVTRPVYINYDPNIERGIITPCNKASYGDYNNFVPSVEDGIMDVGKTIDFHLPDSISDHDMRLQASAAGLNCSGTFTATKVFNAVWNDYADALLMDDPNNPIKPGYIVRKTPLSNGYSLATKKTAHMAVGVCSDTYGHLLGGEELENMEDNLKRYTPVAVSGNVRVMVTGEIKIGDLITVSNKPGVGKKAHRFFHKPGTIVGKALENKICKGDRRILMQVMLL